MYEIMKKMDTISQILPQTVNRLVVLSEIHQQGKMGSAFKVFTIIENSLKKIY